MGCHIMDASFSILGQAIPEKIEVESSPISDLNAPVWTRLRYHFAATDKHPALVVSWHDGLGDDGKPNKPERDPRVPEAAFDKATSGMMFIGTDGVVFEPDAYCEHPVIFPEERFTDVKKEMADGKIKQTEKRSPMPDNPQGEWAHYIVNGGGLPSSNFDYAAPLAEFVSLGNLAIRSKAKRSSGTRREGKVTRSRTWKPPTTSSNARPTGPAGSGAGPQGRKDLPQKGTKKQREALFDGSRCSGARSGAHGFAWGALELRALLRALVPLCETFSGVPASPRSLIRGTRKSHTKAQRHKALRETAMSRRRL